MTTQVLFFNSFSEKDPHLDAVEFAVRLLFRYFRHFFLSIVPKNYCVQWTEVLSIPVMYVAINCFYLFVVLFKILK